MRKRVIKQLLLTILIIFMTACVPSGQLTRPMSAFTNVPPTLTLTLSVTPIFTSTPTPIRTVTPFPSPTATPRVHTVKLGETMGGIAWIYNVSLEELLELNPDINPNTMTVGMEVLIPATTLTPADLTPQPTPIQLPLEGLNCLPDAEQGVWCFVWVHNTSDEAFENVTVGINLADMNATQVFSKQGTASLNVLRSAEKIPVAVYFPGPIPQPVQKSAQFISAIPYNPESNRYLTLTPQIDLQEMKLDHQLVTLTGKISLSQPVLNVTMVAVAFDDQGNMIGVRQWQSGFTDPADEVAFRIDLASVSGKIADYSLLAEAQP